MMMLGRSLKHLCKAPSANGARTMSTGKYSLPDLNYDYAELEVPAIYFTLLDLT